jgi:hypothetical protein
MSRTAAATAQRYRLEAANPASLDVRPLMALGVAGVGLIHVLDFPNQVRTVPWLAVTYVPVIVASVIVAAGLVVRPAPYRLAAVVVALMPAAAFVVSRTVGLPGDAVDRGNWGDPLGLASLFVEIAVVALATRWSPAGPEASGNVRG